jgi:hypothetical protein
LASSFQTLGNLIKMSENKRETKDFHAFRVVGMIFTFHFFFLFGSNNESKKYYDLPRLCALKKVT